MTLRLIRVGRRVINLEYLIVAEEWDGTAETEQLMPGGVRLTLETGRVLTLQDGDADTLLKHLEEEAPRTPHPAGRVEAVVGRQCDPATGETLGPRVDAISAG